MDDCRIIGYTNGQIYQSKKKFAQSWLIANNFRDWPRVTTIDFSFRSFEKLNNTTDHSNNSSWLHVPIGNMGWAPLYVCVTKNKIRLFFYQLPGKCYLSKIRCPTCDTRIHLPKKYISLIKNWIIFYIISIQK